MNSKKISEAKSRLGDFCLLLFSDGKIQKRLCFILCRNRKFYMTYKAFYSSMKRISDFGTIKCYSVYYREKHTARAAPRCQKSVSAVCSEDIISQLKLLSVTFITATCFFFLLFIVFKKQLAENIIYYNDKHRYGYHYSSRAEL